MPTQVNTMPTQDPIKLWQHAHGASVHFALALALVSVAFDWGSIMLRKPEWRTVGFWALFVAVVLSVPALFSGLWGQLGWFHAEKWEAESVLRHRNFALAGTITLLGLLIWRVLTRDFDIELTRRPDSGSRTQAKHFLPYLLLATLAAGAIGYTGFLGGYVARGY